MFCSSKIRVSEQILSFLFRFDSIRLGLLGIGPEDGDQVFVFPGLDVIVGSVHAVDITLDRVAFVDDDESVLCDLIRGEGGRSKGSKRWASGLTL